MTSGKNRLGMANAFRVRDWLSANLELFSKEGWTLAEAAEKATSELNIVITAATLGDVRQKAGIKWNSRKTEKARRGQVPKTSERTRYKVQMLAREILALVEINIKLAKLVGLPKEEIENSISRVRLETIYLGKSLDFDEEDNTEDGKDNPNGTPG